MTVATSLARSPETILMRIGILTDLHLRQPGAAPDGWHNPHQFETARQRLTAALDFLGSERVDRIAILGDLTHDGDPATFEDVLAILASAPVPAWIVPGNHDLGADPTDLGTAMVPHLPQLDLLSGTSRSLANGWRATGLGITRGEGGYLIDPEPDLGEWDDSPTLVLSHFPLLSLKDEAIAADLKYAGDPLNGPGIVTHLKARPGPTLVISGHLHIRHAQAQGPVLQASCGAQVESLFEATVLDLTEWATGIVRWTATAIDPVWPGIVPALSEPEQAWRWTGSGWEVMTS
jgi:hypothetical protein